MCLMSEKIGWYIKGNWRFTCEYISNWHSENEQLGIVPNLTDIWTPEQRKRSLREWQDDEVIVQTARSEKRMYEDNDEACEVSDDEEQRGRGQDGFSVEKRGEVNVKKFKTKDMRYHIQFTNVFANMELSQYHDRLHEIFQSLLDRVIGDVPSQDQVHAFCVAISAVGDTHILSLYATATFNDRVCAGRLRKGASIQS